MTIIARQGIYQGEPITPAVPPTALEVFYDTSDYLVDFVDDRYRLNGTTATQSQVTSNLIPRSAEGVFVGTTTINKTINPLNELTSTFSLSAGTMAVVEVADLPTGPREYFQGILGGRVQRVFWYVADGVQSSSQATSQGTVGATDAGATHTVSGFVWAVSGSWDVRLTNLTPTSAIATIGQGQRLTATVTTNVISGNSWRIRGTVNGECYFCAPQLELGSTATDYFEHTFRLNLLDSPNTSWLASGGGRIVCEVLLPTDRGTGRVALFSLFRDAALLVLVRWWWDTGLILIQVGANQLSGIPAAWSPEVPLILALDYDVAGNIQASVNGSALLSVATGINMAGMNGLHLGSSKALGISLARADFLEGFVRRFAFKGAA